MPRYFLQLNTPEIREKIHGVDYFKNEQECGRKHEFMTKNCHPILFTEAEIDGWDPEANFVEVSTWNSTRVEAV